jgi:hypothetical protein
MPKRKMKLNYKIWTDWPKRRERSSASFSPALVTIVSKYTFARIKIQKPMKFLLMNMDISIKEMFTLLMLRDKAIDTVFNGLDQE